MFGIGENGDNVAKKTNGLNRLDWAKMKSTKENVNDVEEEGDSLWTKVSPVDIVSYYEGIGNWKHCLPKTDYTYSPSSPLYNKEIAPGIPTVPNMCRVTLDQCKDMPSSTYRCSYGTDFISDTNKSGDGVTAKIKRLVNLLFNWLYISRVWQSTLNVLRVTFVNLISFSSRLGRATYDRFVKVRAWRTTKFITWLLIPLLLASTMGYYFLSDHSKSDNLLLLNDIPSFAGNVANNAVFRMHEITDRVSVPVGFSKVLFIVQDIIQCGIRVPLLLLQTLIYNLVDLITASAMLAATWLWYIVNYLPSVFTGLLSSSNSPDGIKAVRDLNYTKLAEELLSLNDVKNTVESRGKNPRSSDDAVNLESFAAELKKLIQRSNVEENDNITLLRILNSTLINDVVLKHVENVVQEMLRQNQLPLPPANTPITATADNYVTEDRLDKIVSNLSRNLTRHINDDMKNTIGAFLKQSELELHSMVEKRLELSSDSRSLTAVNFTQFETYINRSIQRALKIYDADKTGMVDYALETSGGIILSTRCTETMTSPISFTVLNIPLWRMQTNPRIVIQPGVHPGQCWAFAGSVGFLVIQLSQLIRVTGFTLEHIPKSLAPNGVIDSAPKEFSVWGLSDETEIDSQVFLGSFTYDAERGDSIQYFEAVKTETSFQIVELRVESNHGRIEYTCIYRFRVHGIPFTL